MKRSLRSLLIILALLLASGCVSTPAPDVFAGNPEYAIRDRLYFGRAIPGGGEVSDADWAVFLDDVVTPRFPSGFVAWSTEGQWRSADGTIARERGWIAEFGHADTAAADRPVVEIAAEYKRRFKQEAVFRVRSRGEANAM